MYRQKNTSEIWSGWYFAEGLLIDECGNRYTKQAVKAVYFEKQLPAVSKLLIHSGCKGCPKAH